VLLAFAGQLTTSFGQSVGGAWKGELLMTGGCFAENHLEVQLIISGTSITGTVYQYLNTENYLKKDLSGTYDEASQTYLLQESAATSFQIPNTCFICMKNYQLKYANSNGVETLTGTWDGIVMGRGTRCAPGTITLSRAAKAVFTEPPRIYADTGDIRLDFYDNGEVDGDSITVLVNKNTVVSHQKLGIKPITIFVKVDGNSPFNLVEMIAENLGTIPPNTAVLIITAGTKKYRLFLTSTRQKTASVQFVYHPEKSAADKE